MSNTITETSLCSKLCDRFHERYPLYTVFNHSDRATSGVPDVSITAWRTVWLELKLADPDFDSSGLQEITMRRLARFGRAFYVIYTFDRANDDRGVLVIPQKSLQYWKQDRFKMALLVHRDGFDHDAVIDFVAPLLLGD